ncbi:hypothetical protein D3C85_1572050 [compost metagenome]
MLEELDQIEEFLPLGLGRSILDVFGVFQIANQDHVSRQVALPITSNKFIESGFKLRAPLA